MTNAAPRARAARRTSGTTTGSRIPGGRACATTRTRKTTRTTPATSGNASATDWRLPWRRTPRVSRDAAAASSAGKFTKAEHYLRQLVALRVAGGDGGPRQSRQSRFRAFVGTVGARRGRRGRHAGDNTFACYLSRRDGPFGSFRDASVRRPRRRRARARAAGARSARAEEPEARRRDGGSVRTRAPAAIAAENGDDDAGVAADSDAEASTRLAALDGPSAASAALDSKQGDRDALRYARRALAYAEKRFGPWDRARRARRANRGGALAPRRRRRRRRRPEGAPGSSSGGGGEAESAGVATATAIDLLRDALEVTEKALGKNHAIAIETMCELAAAHKRAGDFPRARRLDEERARGGARKHRRGGTRAR